MNENRVTIRIVGYALLEKLRFVQPLNSASDREWLDLDRKTVVGTGSRQLLGLRIA